MKPKAMILFSVALMAATLIPAYAQSVLWTRDAPYVGNVEPRCRTGECEMAEKNFRVWVENAPSGYGTKSSDTRETEQACENVVIEDGVLQFKTITGDILQAFAPGAWHRFMEVPTE